MIVALRTESSRPPPARVLARDQQRQLERIAQAQPADLLRGRLRDEQVPALECSAKDREQTARSA
jgi:hypothetical protein